MKHLGLRVKGLRLELSDVYFGLRVEYRLLQTPPPTKL